MMLIAHQMGMTNGEYAFIYTELIEGEAKGNLSWTRGQGTDKIVLNFIKKFFILENKEAKFKLKQANRSLLIVTLNQPFGDQYINFSNQVKDLALKKYNYSYNEEIVC